ncbi:FAD-binding and (Fe-S)-binding domain-containing protein [Raineyella sp. LH-20]|uniref:FAD-binding and (Fe-S)-binding domain-containing protein n=1 Tax=Raineyella sp. LH-20 TaxID=3081204 RepID=UPI0029538B88|nr:FAD-binding and (Fe-S)-binding domain-containing protein [Raineyella sp. LH-20]WOP17780.1 FAD-binding and (Fe-S)-binding domain-containing protein [Raineyella sp. LH-20]
MTTTATAHDHPTLLGSAGMYSDSEFDRRALAHDASHYLVVPQIVATPRSADDIGALFRTARAGGLPLTFRSGGTSLSGQAQGRGILADTRASFRGIEVLDDGARVRVQPGATVRAVNTVLRPYGRKIGPDPASEVACTIGGVVANNSSGMACGTEFNTYRTLESMVLVLPSGTVLDTGAPDAEEKLRRLEPALYAGLDGLRDRVRSRKDSVDTIRQQFSMKNTMGYGLNSFLDHDRPVDILAHLMIGSEGTLGFVAEATLRTVEVLPQVTTGLMVFDTIDRAMTALPDLVASGFATVELMDSVSLRVAQTLSGSPRAITDLHVKDHSALLVEFHGHTQQELADKIAAARPVTDALDLAVPFGMAQDARKAAELWTVRKGLYAAVAGNRPSGTTALLEDVVVPVGALGQTCSELAELFVRHGYQDSVIFGHAKDGNIHFMLNEQFAGGTQTARYEAFTDDMVDVVLGHQGSLKAEHGTGRIMAPFVARQYGQELYEVMVAVKQLCDPDAVLNPGVVLSETPRAYVQDLKQSPTVEEEVDRCVECGYCEPICPSRDLTLTPRKRIALRREITAARQAGNTALADELTKSYRYQGIETCAVDGLCSVNCPLDINTADLVRRLRAEGHGNASQAAWNALARNWGGLTAIGGVAMNVAAAVPPVATGVTDLGRAVVGTDNLQRWTSDLPRGGKRRTPRTSTGPAAVWFPACIHSLFGAAEGGPGVGPAIDALLARTATAVDIPEGINGLCCGTPWSSKGFTRGHATMREKALPILWEATDHGRLPVVVDGASCTEGVLKFQHTDPDQAYGELTIIDAVEFVADRLLDDLVVTHPYDTVVLHNTCSMTHLGLNAAARAIAEKIASSVIVPVATGCCAFAGDRGMLHPELTASATTGEAAEVAARVGQGTGRTAYASANRTCEVGMTRATGQTYHHILELLDLATRP